MVLNFVKRKAVSAKIRGLADQVKTNKEQVAGRFVDNMVKVLKESNGALGLSLLTYQIAVDILSLLIRVFRLLTEDSGVLDMTKTLVSNIIGDIALRLNEFANLSEKILANTDVLDALERLDNSYQRVMDKSKAEFHKSALAMYKENPSYLASLEDEELLEALLLEDWIPEEVRRELPNVVAVNKAYSAKASERYEAEKDAAVAKEAEEKAAKLEQEKAAKAKEMANLLEQMRTVMEYRLEKMSGKSNGK